MADNLPTNLGPFQDHSSTPKPAGTPRGSDLPSPTAPPTVTGDPMRRDFGDKASDSARGPSQDATRVLPENRPQDDRSSSSNQQRPQSKPDQQKQDPSLPNAPKSGNDSASAAPQAGTSLPKPSGSSIAGE